MNTAIDPILGVIRRCGRCKEWWPDDDEFFYPWDRRCKACIQEKNARRTEKRRADYAASLGRPLLPGIGRPRTDAA